MRAGKAEKEEAKRDIVRITEKEQGERERERKKTEARVELRKNRRVRVIGES